MCECECVAVCGSVCASGSVCVLPARLKLSLTYVCVLHALIYHDQLATPSTLPIDYLPIRLLLLLLLPLHLLLILQQQLHIKLKVETALQSHSLATWPIGNQYNCSATASATASAAAFLLLPLLPPCSFPASALPLLLIS